MMLSVNNVLSQAKSIAMSSQLGNTINLPVEPSQLVYSQFKNVRGFVDSSSSVNPVSSLSLVNRLIELNQKLLEEKMGTDATPEKSLVAREKLEIYHELSEIHRQLKEKTNDPIISNELSIQRVANSGQVINASA